MGRSPDRPLVRSTRRGMQISHGSLSLVIDEPPRSAETILIVEDDPDIARFVEVNLRSAGYEVAVAADGKEALDRAQEMRPDLVLLDVLMPPGIDGIEVARGLRRNPRTDTTSIIMVTCLARHDDRVIGLDAGADDYITKPFYPAELLARVRSTLRRNRQLRNVSPLTHLPGTIRIREEIERMIVGEQPFALLYCDIDEFKAYNDHQGFDRGDRLIRATARILQDAVAEYCGIDGFTGHIGGDDFVAVVSPDLAVEVAARVASGFDQQARTFYDIKDVERGYVQVEDRAGRLQTVSLVSISIGVATTRTRTYRHYGEVVEVATEMKQFAKRQAGSSYAVDRRNA
jgi:diguanylate cyclase (GGDEF)-like protein